MIKRIAKPFEILEKEKLYLFWFIAVIVFGLIQLWSGFIAGGSNYFSIFINSGNLYTFVLALCVPLSTEVFLDLIVEIKKGNNIRSIHFVNFKAGCILLSIIFLAVTIMMWYSKSMNNITIQIIIFTIGTLMSFYMFCLCKYSSHPDLEGSVDLYNKEEKEDMEKTNTQSKEVKTYIQDGKEIKL